MIICRSIENFQNFFEFDHIELKTNRSKTFLNVYSQLGDYRYFILIETSIILDQNDHQQITDIATFFYLVCERKSLPEIKQKK